MLAGRRLVAMARQMVGLRAALQVLGMAKQRLAKERVVQTVQQRAVEMAN